MLQKGDVTPNVVLPANEGGSDQLASVESPLSAPDEENTSPILVDCSGYLPRFPQSISQEGDTTTPRLPPILVDDVGYLPKIPRNLKGGKKIDNLVGGEGDDQLNGGLGRDKLTGGNGKDAFAFTTKLGGSNADYVTDFQSTDDTFLLSHKVFKGTGKGVLSKEAFRVGAKAMDADDRIIYNAKTGALSYDADGSGTAHAAVTFAKVKVGTHLTADDFLVL